MFEVPETKNPQFNSASMPMVTNVGAIAAAILQTHPLDVAAYAEQITELDVLLGRGQEGQKKQMVQTNRTRITAIAYALANKGFAPVFKEEPTKADMAFGLGGADAE